MWSMVGFSIYTYEGIGILMPVMQACECPEKFDKILMAAIFTLTSAYIIFGTLCYLSFGDLKVQLITQILPQDKLYAKVLILAQVVVLVFTYPLVIYPTNQTLEKVSIDTLFKRSSISYWLKNFSRLAVCFLATYSAIELSAYLDKFIGLLGALLCAPLALIIPTICHFKLVARTRS